MEHLVYWNCKEKNSALPKKINEFGDTVGFEDICAQLATIYDIVGDISMDRLKELVDADKEERCVILPVKPGTQVWSTVFCRIDEDGKEHPTFPWEFTVSMLDEWGTGWHLTEKDAMDELEKENENGED